MKQTHLLFVGGGNMASSLIGGLIADHVPATHITVTDTNPQALARLAARFGVNTGTDTPAAVASADVVILAVKPQVLKTVVQEIAASVQRRQPLVISIAAGITSTSLANWLGGNVALVRAMPNTPALVQTGATALHANNLVKPGQKDQAESILRAVGLALWVENEAQMDTVTALSGSGPAYFFRIMEALETAAVSRGLSPETAHLLTLQTALGAAKMALEAAEPLAILRERVTSPGGTTEQGLRVLNEHDIDALIAEVIEAAEARSRELAAMLGK